MLVSFQQNYLGTMPLGNLNLREFVENEPLLCRECYRKAKEEEKEDNK